MSATETVLVENIDQFVQYLTGWHQNKVAVLLHMMSIPEGSEVAVDEGPMVPLTGPRREGFILGLKLALGEFGELPFEAEVEDHVNNVGVLDDAPQADAAEGQEAAPVAH